MTEEMKTLESGSWDNVESFPEKIKFETDVTHRVTFADDFDKPLEMPNTDGKGVFYIFNCTEDGKRRSINTSSWTMLAGLKSKMPLAKKTLDITKKNVGGKNKFYISEVVEGKVVEEKEEELQDY